MDSFALPGKLFTAQRSVIDRMVGRLNADVFELVRDATVRLIRPA